MESSLPTFLFFLKKTMTAAVASDYDRGLPMLKGYFESSSDPSESTILS